MNKRLVFKIVGLLLLFVFVFLTHRFYKSSVCRKHKFVVFVPSYNNVEWYRYNLSSIFNQKYKNYRVIYIDDASTDGTYDLVRQYINQYGLWSQVTLLHNKHNKGALYNTYKAIHMCDDNEILVTLDGDDWFAHANVLSYLNNVYQNKNIWLTYGQFLNWPTFKRGWCKPIPPYFIKKNQFREYGFVGAQLRSYYVWLAKKIKLKHLISPINDYKGKFFPSAGDVALMFPMFEMAGNHFKFISDILCIRNVKTPLNDFKVHRKKQLEITKFLRKWEKYKPLHKKEYGSSESKGDLIIFSYDRPMQLYAFLESIKRHMQGMRKISVIYRTSNKSFEDAYDEVKKNFEYVQFIKQQERSDFKPLLLKLLEQPSYYVLFAVDDMLLVDCVDLTYCIYALKKTKSFGFFLRLGKNITYSYMNRCDMKQPFLQKVDPDVRIFRFDMGDLDWAYPFSLDMTVYPTQKVLKLLRNVDFNSPNTLERNIYNFMRRKGFKDKVGLCGKHSKIINIANNKVQEDYKFNRSGGNCDKNILLDKFKMGYRINIDKFSNKKNSSCHIEMPLDFVKKKSSADIR